MTHPDNQKPIPCSEHDTGGDQYPITDLVKEIVHPMSNAIYAYMHKTLAEIEQAHERKLIGAGYSVEKTHDTAGPVYLVTKAGEANPYRVTTDTHDIPTACNCPWFRAMHENSVQSKDGVTIARTEAACKHLYLSFMTYRADNHHDITARQFVHAVGELYNDFYQHGYDGAPKKEFGYNAA